MTSEPEPLLTNEEDYCNLADAHITNEVTNVDDLMPSGNMHCLNPFTVI